MSESVSGVDAIVSGLRDRAWDAGYTVKTRNVVSLADAEAAVLRAWDEGFAAGVNVQQKQIDRTVPKIAANAWEEGYDEGFSDGAAADVLADQIAAEFGVEE